MFKRIALVAMFALGIATAASAAPITYIHTGFGSGTLDGVAFGSLAPVAFTITATGDTNNIQACSPTCVFIDNLTASINIAGLGSVDFTTATRYFSNLGNDTVGFSRAGAGGADLFNGPTVVDWDMTVSVGPIVGTGSLLQWTNTPVNTTGGVLVFNSAATAATFQARVPEPMTLTLLGVGLAAIARRRARA